MIMYLVEEHMKPNKPVSALKNKRKTNSQLRKILDESGRLYICDWCRCEKMTLDNGEWLWRGLPLKLQIDHIHGLDGTDNQDRLDNLRYLCPNCHSQTPNFCGKQLAIKNQKKQLSGIKKQGKDMHQQSPVKGGKSQYTTKQ